MIRWATGGRACALLAAGLLWPMLSFAQNIFIDRPFEGETLPGPTVKLRMSVSGFQPGTDGRISLSMDGAFMGETDRLRLTFAVAPGTHELEARLVDRRSRPIETSQPDSVKFTVAEPSF